MVEWPWSVYSRDRTRALINFNTIDRWKNTQRRQVSAENEEMLLASRYDPFNFR